MVTLDINVGVLVHLSGASIGLSDKSLAGSASVGKIDSNYKSVTDQSGIYAGEDGFNIRVEDNTDLKGGIISSTADADKNKLSTGTLTFEDIQNKADYKAGGAGIKVNKNNDAEYNEKGVTPDIGMPASGEAESTTKATISKGAIEIRDKENQKQDITKLNRDTQNSLNKLGEIFDKTKVEERQELANLFGELAYNEIHYMDGSNEQKALYHAVVGGIMSKLTGGDFLAGATAAGINKLVIEEVKKAANYDPDKMQWVSAVLGAVVAEFVSGNPQAGGSIASSATKNNDLREEMLAQYGIDPSKVKVDEVKDDSILIEGNLSLDGAILLSISGEGLKELTNKINDTIKIDTSHISPSMNIAYDTGIPSYNKVLLNGVSKVADSAITIGSTTYSIYMDATKYSGVSLGAAMTLDLSTLYFISKGEQWVSNATNAPVMVIKLVSGGTAYLVDEKLTTPMKESIDKRLPHSSVIEHRINDLNNGGIE